MVDGLNGHSPGGRGFAVLGFLWLMVQGALSAFTQSIGPGLINAGWTLETLSYEGTIEQARALAVGPQGRLLITSSERVLGPGLTSEEDSSLAVAERGFRSVADRLGFQRSVKSRSMMADWNGDGATNADDWFVGRERIHWIELDKNGFIPKSSGELLVAPSKMESRVIGTTYWDDQHLYLGFPPEIQRFPLSRSFQLGERPATFAGGIGVRFSKADHGINAIVKGLDGWVYWSVGDMGTDGSHFDGGAIYRSQADGSAREVFATGFRNPISLVFDPLGNLWTIDQLSGAEGQSRLLQVAQGADYGWRYGNQESGSEGYAWSLRVLPAVALLKPTVTSFVLAPHVSSRQATSGSFFLVADSESGVQAMGVRRQADGWEVDPQGLPSLIYRASDICDMVTDLKGAIVLLRATSKAIRLERLQPEGLVSTPTFFRVSSVPLNEMLMNQIVRSLDHQDHRLRRRMLESLIERSDGRSVLEDLSKRANPRRARVASITGLGVLATRGDSEAQRALIRLIRDDDENIRLAVYRALGQCTARPVRGLFRVIERGLGDVSPPVRTAACLALGGFGNPDAAELYLELSRHWGEVFPHLRHGIVVGLAQCGNHEALMEGALDNEFAVRMVCCLALERLGRNEMAYFLTDTEDARLVAEAARVLYVKGELNHLSVLAGMLKQGSASFGYPQALRDVIHRRSLAANSVLGRTEHAAAIVDFLKNDQSAGELKQVAAELLSQWGERQRVDPVTGAVSEDLTRSATAAKIAMSLAVSDLLSMKESPEVLASVIEALASLRVTRAFSDLAQIADDDEQSTVVKLAARQALRTFGDSSRDVGSDPLSSARRPGGSREVTIADLDQWLSHGSVAEKRNAMKRLGERTDAAARALLLKWVVLMERGKVAEEIELDILLAATKGVHSSVKRRVEKWLEGRDLYDFVFSGGSVDQGERVFNSSQLGDCLRCHAVDSPAKEPQLGPLLKRGSGVDKRMVLSSILQPNQRVKRRYEGFDFELPRGLRVRGRRVKELEDKVQLLTDKGEMLIVDSSDIRRSVEMGSLMPKDYRKRLSALQMRDLLAYLANE